MTGASAAPARWGAIVVTLMLVALAGCGVEPEASPRDLPDDEQDWNVSVTDPVADTSATGASRVYFIAPGEERLLRSVQREAGSEYELIDILLQGPNEEEVQAGYDTAVPATTELLGVSSLAGVLTVNLTSDIEELDNQALIRAISQIVYTASEWDTVESVQIRIEGQNLSAPTPDGNATTQPVRIYDYPDSVITSQPAFPAAPLTGTA